jgi:hypothetical protein
MSKETQAVLLIFDGTEVDKATIVAITNALAECCGTAKVNTFVYSAKEIADMIIRNVGTAKTINLQSVDELSPEDNAIIYIGTVMKDALEAPYNNYNLFRALMKKIDELSTDHEERKRFMNALFILSQENLEVSRALMRKYHLSQEKIATIRNTYNFFTKL